MIVKISKMIAEMKKLCQVYVANNKNEKSLNERAN